MKSKLEDWLDLRLDRCRSMQLLCRFRQRHTTRRQWLHVSIAQLHLLERPAVEDSLIVLSCGPALFSLVCRQLGLCALIAQLVLMGKAITSSIWEILERKYLRGVFDTIRALSLSPTSCVHS